MPEDILIGTVEMPSPKWKPFMVDPSYRGKRVKNPDGSESSELTKTFEIEGKFYNLPSIYAGKPLPDDEIVNRFKAGRLPAVGVADTGEEAERLAVERSRQLGSEDVPIGTVEFSSREPKIPKPIGLGARKAAMVGSAPVEQDVAIGTVEIPEKRFPWKPMIPSVKESAQIALANQVPLAKETLAGITRAAEHVLSPLEEEEPETKPVPPGKGDFLGGMKSGIKPIPQEKPQFEDVVKPIRELLGKAAGTLEKQAEKEKIAPYFEPGSVKGYMFNAMQSLARNMVFIGAGLATGGGTTLPMVLMGVDVGAQKFDEKVQILQQKYGNKPVPQEEINKALLYSTGEGAAEVVGERVPLGIMMNPAGKLLRKAVLGTLAEIGQEEATEVLDWALEHGYLGTTPTAKDARRFLDTAIVTAMSTPVLAGATHGMLKSAQIIEALEKHGVKRTATVEPIGQAAEEVQKPTKAVVEKYRKKAQRQKAIVTPVEEAPGEEVTVQVEPIEIQKPETPVEAPKPEGAGVEAAPEAEVKAEPTPRKPEGVETKPYQGEERRTFQGVPTEHLEAERKGLVEKEETPLEDAKRFEQIARELKYRKQGVERRGGAVGGVIEEGKGKTPPLEVRVAEVQAKVDRAAEKARRTIEEKKKAGEFDKWKKVEEIQEKPVERQGLPGEAPIEVATKEEEKPKPETLVEREGEVKAIPESSIADKVKEHIKGNRFLTADQLFSYADEAFGGTQAEGKYVAKDAYDAMELGVNRYIVDQLKPDMKTAPSATVTALKELIQRLPTQTKRTEESQGFQQFSTPPPLAYVANWVANLNEDDVYLEPSAGIGGLAVFAKNAGVKEIVANELSERRRKILETLGFDRVFAENAEQLNNVLPKDVKPTVVVMNPPFSQTAGRLGTKKVTETGAIHVEQALKRLLDNGRLVAIMGRGMALDRPAFRDWWKEIRGKYNVRAVVGVSGKEYTKYGTSFDNIVAVIDKNGPTMQEPITGDVEKVEDLIDLLKGVRDERPAITARTVEGKPQTAQPGREEGAPRGEAETGPALSVLPSVEPMGTGRGEIPTEQPGARTDTGEYVGGETGGGYAGVRGEPGGRTGRPESEISRETGEPIAQPVREPISPEGRISTTPEGVQVQAKEIELSKEELSESLYENYKPQKISVPGSKPHPTKLVESAAMAFVEPPTPTYRPHLPKEMIQTGKISEAQIEPVIYAGQAHSQTLPNGTRMGHFIGDGTGVGKGRIIASIILDNWNQGRKKAIWLSQNKPLIKAAQDDVESIGWNPKLVFDIGKTKLGSNIEIKEGIAFVGYDTLKVKKTDQGTLIEKSRLQQLVDWFGPDYDGVIVFDESHNLGNALAVRGPMGTKMPSEKAIAGLELQRALPNARIEYVSATGATDVINLAYAERLGLWGEETSFANVQDFVEKISAGGIAAMEMVAQNLKAMGKYNARSLDMKGVSYEILEHTLTDNQREIYDEMARAWQIVLNNINAAIQVTGARKNGTARRNSMSAFWGANQRFFNQIITSMQTASVITAIEKDLKEGRAAVVQLVNTNEAALSRALSRIEEAEEIEDLDLTPREQLMEYIRHSFPVQQYEEYVDEDGNTKSRPVVDSQGNPVENTEAVAMREALLDRLGSLKVPDGPLELLFNHFGQDKIAEVTGRTKRVVTVTDEKGTRKEVQRWSSAKSMVDADNFLSDKKQILVFSYAGGTGRSYHADLRVKNQRPRRHYGLQLGWRGDKAIQGFGRTHRTNQKQPPEYIPVTTDLKGQKRFTSSIARRLDQIGALSKGERKTGGQGFFTARDNLESEYAQNALSRLIEDLHRHNVADMTIQDFEREAGLRLTDEHGNLLRQRPDTSQFMNRILSMTIDNQNKIFDLFSQRLDENIQRAIEEGTLDQGLETLKAKRIEKVKEQVVHTDEKTGAKANYVEVEAWHDADLLTFEGSKKFATSEYAQNIRSGTIYALSAIRSKTNRYGDIEEFRTLRGVNNTPHQVSVKDLNDAEKYRNFTQKDAEPIWDASYDRSPKEVREKKHLVTGSILPIWDRILGHPRILRVQTTGGERFIGRIIPPHDLEATLTNIGATAESVTMTPEELHAHVLNQNYTVTLSNGWQIVRRRVSGDNRIEIKNVDYRFMEELKRHGAFTERVDYQTRLFVPTGEEGVKTIEHMVKTAPVVSADAPTVMEHVRNSIADTLSDESGFIDLSSLAGVTDKVRQAVADFSNNRILSLLPGKRALGEGIEVKMGPEKHMPGPLAAIQNMEGVMSQTKPTRNSYEAGRDFKGNTTRDARHWRERAETILNPLDAEEKLAVIEILDTQEDIDRGESKIEDAAADMRDLLDGFRDWMIENGQDVGKIEGYFPHVFHGKFWVKLAKGEQALNTILGEEGDKIWATKVDTYNEAVELARQLNEKTGKKVTIMQDTVIPSMDDVTLLSNKSYWRLVKTLKDTLGEAYGVEEDLDAKEINRLLRKEGVAKPKPRQRFFGNMLPRLTENPNFLKDIDKVMDLFFYGGVRKVHQDIFMKNVQRNIDAMPVEDQRLKQFVENVYLPATLAHPTNMEEWIAKVIGELGISPGATGQDARRWLHNVNLVQYTMDLGLSFISAGANGTQYWQNVYPIIGEESSLKGYLKGGQTFRDPNLMKEVEEMNIASGVSSITGQPLLHGMHLKEWFRHITMREGFSNFQNATLVLFQGIELMNRFSAYWGGKDFALKSLKKGQSAEKMALRVTPETSSLVDLGKEYDQRMADTSTQRNFAWRRKTEAMQKEFAKKFGFELNEKANFRVGRENLPQLLNNMPVRIASPYKSFVLNQLIYTLETLGPRGKFRKEGVKGFLPTDPAKALRFVGVTLLAGGVVANPILYGMFLLINQLSKWLFDRDLEKELTIRKLARGMSGKLGFDISGSVAIQLPKRAEDLLGRFGKLALELGKLGYEKVTGRGTIFTERKLGRLAQPSEAQRAVDALTILREGQYVTPIRQIPIALNDPPWKAAAKRFLGALPESVVEEFSIEQFLRERAEIQKSISTDMTERWATAVTRGDEKDMANVVERVSRSVLAAAQRLADAGNDPDRFSEALSDFLFWDAWVRKTPKFKNAMERKLVPKQIQGLKRVPVYLRPEAIEMKKEQLRQLPSGGKP